MARNLVLTLGVFVAWNVFSGQALAQRNFSRSQQAGMQAFITQQRAQDRVSQNRSFEQINRRLMLQQRQINNERNRETGIVDYLSTTGGTQSGPPQRRVSAETMFSDPHFASPMFMRVNPYYNYSYIHSRNRPFNPFTGQ